MATLRRWKPPADGITVRRLSRGLFQQHRPNSDMQQTTRLLASMPFQSSTTDYPVRSAPRPPSGLPEVTVADRIALLPCREPGNPRISKPVPGSSGESRLTEGRGGMNTQFGQLPS